MKARPLSSVAAAVGGERTGDDVDVSSVTTDSRQAGPGALFVALEGERTDGHRFVLDALARGAAAVLVRDAADAPVPKIQVASTADALLRLAAVAGLFWLIFLFSLSLSDYFTRPWNGSGMSLARPSGSIETDRTDLLGPRLPLDESK